MQVMFDKTAIDNCWSSRPSTRGINRPTIVAYTLAYLILYKTETQSEDRFPQGIINEARAGLSEYATYAAA